MSTPTRSERADTIRALLLCRRHVPLALWLLGTLLCGAVAGAVLAAVWVAAIWRGARLV